MAASFERRWRPGLRGAVLLGSSWLGASVSACVGASGPEATNPAAARERVWEYRVVAAPGARELRVEVDLPPGVPEVLGVDLFADPFVRDAEVATERGWQPLLRMGTHWHAPRCRSQGCSLRYRYRLGEAAERIDRFAYAGYRAGALLAPPSTFLLAPQEYEGNDRYRFHVRTAPGESFVTGVWRDPSGTGHAAPASVLFQAPYSGFGHFELERLVVGANEDVSARGNSAHASGEAAHRRPEPLGGEAAHRCPEPLGGEAALTESGKATEAGGKRAAAQAVGDAARSGRASHDTHSNAEARHGEARHGGARHGGARHGEARRGEARRDIASDVGARDAEARSFIQHDASSDGEARHGDRDSDAGATRDWRAVISLALAPGEVALRVSREGLRRAVREAAAMVSNYYGRFPVPEVTLIVLPTPGASTAGMQLGNGGATIVFFLGSDVDDVALESDWVLTHEFFHLGFPTLRRRHLWLAEGLATYQGPIARARAGSIDERELWRQFTSGMPQGLPSGNDGGLDGNLRWGRTYWGGALFCLLLDVELRARTDNRLSLDAAARAILMAGGDTSVRWSATRTLSAGDSALDWPSFSKLYAEHSAAPVRIDFAGLLRRLGVRLEGQEVAFDEHAELAHVRRAIAGR
jgi:hypothetical protein